MNRTTLAALLLAAPAVSFATNNTPAGQAQSAANAAAAAQSVAASAAQAGAFSASIANPVAAAFAAPVAQGGAGGQGGSAELNLAVPAQQTFTHNGRQQIANVPSVFLPSVYPTATCLNGVSVGGSGVGGGGGVGFFWQVDDCRRGEVARQFDAMGLRDDAVAVLCEIEVAKVAPSCEKRAPKPAAAPAKEEWNGGE